MTRCSSTSCSTRAAATSRWRATNWPPSKRISCCERPHGSRQHRGDGLGLEQAAPGEDESTAESHELCAVLKSHGFSLNSTLIEMLGEHYSHRTERRGCGYTQASRHLAVLVNRARDAGQDTAGQLFPSWARAEQRLQHVLFELSAELQREESRVMAALITDLVLPAAACPGVQELPPFAGEIKVGT